jgi:hypothetical protein
MRIVAFLIAALTSQFLLAAEPAKDLPKPLPDTTTKAWINAGATLGWMKYDNDTGLVFLEKPEVGAVPAFKFTKWQEGQLTKLPAPAEPFGVYLAKTEIGDPGLKELARFKTLSSLCLCETEATFDAVDALRKLLPKCFIFHC